MPATGICKLIPNSYKCKVNQIKHWSNYKLNHVTPQMHVQRCPYAVTSVEIQLRYRRARRLCGTYLVLYLALLSDISNTTIKPSQYTIPKPSCWRSVGVVLKRIWMDERICACLYAICGYRSAVPCVFYTIYLREPAWSSTYSYPFVRMCAQTHPGVFVRVRANLSAPLHLMTRLPDVIVRFSDQIAGLLRTLFAPSNGALEVSICYEYIL